MKLRSFWTP